MIHRQTISRIALLSSIGFWLAACNQNEGDGGANANAAGDARSNTVNANWISDNQAFQQALKDKDAALQIELAKINAQTASQQAKDQFASTDQNGKYGVQSTQINADAQRDVAQIGADAQSKSSLYGAMGNVASAGLPAYFNFKGQKQAAQAQIDSQERMADMQLTGMKYQVDGQVQTAAIQSGGRQVEQLMDADRQSVDYFKEGLRSYENVVEAQTELQDVNARLQKASDNGQREAAASLIVQQGEARKALKAARDSAAKNALAVNLVNLRAEGKTDAENKLKKNAEKKIVQLTDNLNRMAGSTSGVNPQARIQNHLSEVGVAASSSATSSSGSVVQSSGASGGEASSSNISPISSSSATTPAPVTPVASGTIPTVPTVPGAAPSTGATPTPASSAGAPAPSTATVQQPLKAEEMDTSIFHCGDSVQGDCPELKQFVAEIAALSKREKLTASEKTDEANKMRKKWSEWAQAQGAQNPSEYKTIQLENTLNALNNASIFAAQGNRDFFKSIPDNANSVDLTKFYQSILMDQQTRSQSTPAAAGTVPSTSGAKPSAATTPRPASQPSVGSLPTGSLAALDAVLTGGAGADTGKPGTTASRPATSSSGGATATGNNKDLAGTGN